MKHTIFLALPLFLICYTQHIIGAYNWPTVMLPIHRTTYQINNSPTLTASKDENIAVLDNAINAQYNTIDNALHIIMGSSLTASDCHTIINSFADCSITPNEHLITALCTKNDAFNYAIEYFIDLARKNLDNVTVDTLETVQNPSLKQPIEELNALPTFIKHCIMERAYNSIDLAYTISLTKHEDIIIFFDLHAATHRAATSSADRKFRLWDLQTGNIIHIFPNNDDYINYINFNTDGSCMVTASNYDDNTSLIKTWNTESGQLINTTQLTFLTDTVRYTNDNMIIACDGKQTMPTIVTMAADTLKTVTEAKLHYKVCTINNLYINWENVYRTENPHIQEFGSTLSITKINCRPLYLCMQAAKNIQHLPSPIINEKPSYKKLTTHEKDIVAKKQSEKIEALKMLQQLIQTTYALQPNLLTYK